VNPLAGQDEHETLETFFRNIDLSFAEKILCECFHTIGPGRPPRSPLGLFRTFIVMGMSGVRSLRKMTSLLNVMPCLERPVYLKKTGKVIEGLFQADSRSEAYIINVNQG
jgi:hypothetical protein